MSGDYLSLSLSFTTADTRKGIAPEAVKAFTEAAKTPEQVQNAQTYLNKLSTQARTL